MKISVSKDKQSTLDDVSFQFNIQKNDESKPEKTIVITQLFESIREEELELKIEFKLEPSKMSFSKVFLDLFFQDQQLSSTPLVIPQSALLSDNLVYTQIVDMSGIEAGSYLFRVEMYELWENIEKLYFSTKQLTLEYIPKKRQDRLVKVPTVKSIAGKDLGVISSETKNIFREIEKDQKKIFNSKKDEW